MAYQVNVLRNPTGAIVWRHLDLIPRCLFKYGEMGHKEKEDKFISENWRNQCRPCHVSLVVKHFESCIWRIFVRMRHRKASGLAMRVSSWAEKDDMYACVEHPMAVSWLELMSVNQTSTFYLPRIWIENVALQARSAWQIVTRQTTKLTRSECPLLVQLLTLENPSLATALKLCRFNLARKPVVEEPSLIGP